MNAQPSITCPRCGATSFNPNDIAEGYCGRCYGWTDVETRERRGAEAYALGLIQGGAGMAAAPVFDDEGLVVALRIWFLNPMVAGQWRLTVEREDVP